MQKKKERGKEKEGERKNQRDAYAIGNATGETVAFLSEN